MQDRLALLDTSTISDALDTLRLPGVASGITRLSTARRICGPVVPVRLELSGGAQPVRHLATDAIEVAQPGAVIVVEHHSRSDCAGWGGLLSHAAHVRRIAGVIVDGMCRDIDESAELGFPVFARGTVPRTARGRVVQTSLNDQICIGGVQVEPGDWVVADGTGVVFISTRHLDEVVAAAEGISSREREMLGAIRAGTPVSQVMSRKYEELANR